MISKEKIVKFNIFIVLVLALTFGSFVTLNGLGLRYAFRTYILVPFIVFVVIWCTGHEKVRCSLSGPIEILYFFFCASTFISGVASFDIYTIVSALIGIVLFFVVSSIPYERLDNLYLLMEVAYIINCILVFHRYSISEINSEGVILAFLGIFILNIICKMRWSNYILFFAASAIIIFLIMMTRARTPLAGFIVADVVTYFYLFSQKPSLKKLVILIISLAAIFYASDMVRESMNQYFFHKWGNQDLSSGRQTYWKMVFDDLHLFGNGMGAGGTIKNLELNAHNSLMQVLGSFGVLPAVFYLLLTITSAIGIKFSRNKIVHINFFCGWFVISMFEDLSVFSSRYIPIVIAFLLHIFMLAKERNLNMNMELSNHDSSLWRE